ncbi:MULTISPECIES: hypothetical protein [unclassified Caballeronia]|uniref:hypothetical protein n=1 Tax=unclassified Caballeronia TaxID=2646786 RepID=UPI00202810EE|nr:MULTISPECIES: hypothetical protein [unclassified Caballeronia]
MLVLQSNEAMTLASFSVQANAVHRDILVEKRPREAGISSPPPHIGDAGWLANVIVLSRWSPFGALGHMPEHLQHSVVTNGFCVQATVAMHCIFFSSLSHREVEEEKNTHSVESARCQAQTFSGV